MQVNMDREDIWQSEIRSKELQNIQSLKRQRSEEKKSDWTQLKYDNESNNPTEWQTVLRVFQMLRDDGEDTEWFWVNFPYEAYLTMGDIERIKKGTAALRVLEPQHWSSVEILDPQSRLINNLDFRLLPYGAFRPLGHVRDPGYPTDEEMAEGKPHLERLRSKPVATGGGGPMNAWFKMHPALVVHANNWLQHRESYCCE